MCENIDIARLKRQIKAARQMGKWHRTRDLCNELGHYYYRLKKYHEALSVFKESLALSEKLRGDQSIAESKKIIAEIASITGQDSMAIKYAEEYLTFVTRTNNKLWLHTAYALIGKAYLCLGENLKIIIPRKRPKPLSYAVKKSLTAFETSLGICEELIEEMSEKERISSKVAILQQMGLVMELENNYSEAQSYYTMGIMLGKRHNVKDGLYYCYLNQGAVEWKIKHYNNALDHFELASKTTKSSSKIKTSLNWKAKVYFSMGNFTEAKQTLRHICQLDTGHSPSTIHKLRIAVHLCKLEKKLLAAEANDFELKFKLYENLGDANSVIRNFNLAIEHYLKMLECGRKLGKTEQELLPAYTSLCQTYKDSQNYQMALFYAVKEFEANKDRATEAIQTLIDMSEIHQLMESPLEIVTDCLYKAIKIADEWNLRRLQAKTLKNLVRVNKDYGEVDFAMEADQARKKLKETHDVDDSTSDGDEEREYSLRRSEEDSDDESPIVTQFVIDVDDSELFSDGEEGEQRNLVSRKNYKVRKSYKVKKNAKGETLLHKAAIDGNYMKTKSLLDQGHPIDVFDGSGWTPLHEACNYGHKNVVRLLLDYGADLNSAGGEGAGGLRPLHDACQNGHYDVIDLLLTKGASTAVLTDYGLTPLDCLKDWISRRELSSADEHIVFSLKQRLKTDLDNPEARKRRMMNLEPLESSQRRENPRDKSIAENLVPTSRPSTSAVAEYKAAMAGVRKSSKNVVPSKKPLSEKKLPLPLVDEDDVLNDEDWLVPDSENAEVVIPKKRRKVSPLDDPIPSSSADTSKQDASPRGKTQLTPLAKPSVTSKVKSPQVKAKMALFQSKGQKLLKFRVKILEDCFMIPVFEEKVEHETVSWLMEEATRRYYEVHRLKPLLTLTVADGAILSKSDPLLALVGEEIEGKVDGWRPVGVSQKYRDECMNLERECKNAPRFEKDINFKPIVSVISALDLCRTGDTLSLPNLSLVHWEFIPIFRALAAQKKSLSELDISKNNLGDDGIVELVEYMKVCYITKLNIAENNITERGIRYLGNSLDEIPESNLSRLIELNVSGNDFGNSSYWFTEKIGNCASAFFTLIGGNSTERDFDSD